MFISTVLFPYPSDLEPLPQIYDIKMIYLLHINGASGRFKHSACESANDELLLDGALLLADPNSRVLLHARQNNLSVQIVRVWVARGSRWLKALNRSGCGSYCPVCKSTSKSAELRGSPQKKK